MNTATVTIEGVMPYQQSKEYASEHPKLKNETSGDWERRVWRNRAHTTDKGYIMIPSCQFHKCIVEAAQYLGEKIPGQGNKTWTAKFQAGVLVPEPLVLTIKADNVEGRWVFGSAKGTPGKGPRVWKCFPTIPAGQWGGQVTFLVLDNIISEDVFIHMLEAGGQFIGLGTGRAQVGHGRFKVPSVQWA